MKFPKALRKQLIEYEKAGLTITEVHPRSGSHFLLVFADFPQAQIVSKNSSSEVRAIKNNISLYLRLKREHEDATKSA
jgi:cellulose synthase/poly-beta-1,6-N-acetylglucosamine synthase-like glycosyltransferase